MVEYCRFNVVEANEVDKFLGEGWRIIETSKSAYPEGDTFIKYHIGYPVTRLVEDLALVIREYEKHGFKEKLFDVVATENNENVKDYDTAGFYTAHTPLTKFMENYEDKVNNKKTVFYREPTNEEYKF